MQEELKKFEEKRPEIIRLCKDRMDVDNKANIQDVCLHAMQWRKLSNVELDIIVGEFEKNNKYKIEYRGNSAIISIAPNDFWKQVKIGIVSSIIATILATLTGQIQNHKQTLKELQQDLYMKSINDSLSIRQKNLEDNIRALRKQLSDSLYKEEPVK